MTHTPGPWEVHNGTDVFVEATSGEQIADCYIKPYFPFKVANANARLIAAAPALLAALKAALGAESSKDCYGDHHGYCQGHRLEPIDSCWVKLVEQAIAAAEGGE
jgi:hypothetical protein